MSYEKVVSIFHLRPWSFSKVQKANKCQYEFFFRYVERIEPLTRADFLILGSGVHYVLENALNTVFKSGKPIKKDLLSDFASRFKEMEPEADVSVISSFFPNIVRFVNGQLRRVEKSSFVASEIELAVDEGFRPVDYSSNSVFLRGKLDFVFSRGNTLYIVDHKTSRSWEFNNRIKTQLRWYALLASVKYPEFDRFALEVHNVRYGTISRVLFNRKEIEMFREALISKIFFFEEELEGKVFEELSPSPSESNCRWCEYRHVCPVVDES